MYIAEDPRIGSPVSLGNPGTGSNSHNRLAPCNTESSSLLNTSVGNSTVQANPIFESFWPRMQQAFSNAATDSVRVEFYRQTARVASLDPQRQKLYTDFLQDYFRISLNSARPTHLATTALLSFERLIDALPHYYSEARHSERIAAPPLADVCLHYYDDAESFSKFIDQHLAISRTETYKDYSTAFRVLIRTGLHSHQSAVQIAKSFQELISSDSLQKLDQKSQLEEFLRGLVLNGWPIASSLMSIKDILDRNSNKDKAMELCAKSSLLGSPGDLGPLPECYSFIRPAAVEFLSVDNVSSELLDLGLQLYGKIPQNPEQKNVSARKMFTLLEIISFNTKVEPASVLKKLRLAIAKGSNIDGFLDIMLRNTERSTENLQIRQLIEKLIRAENYDNVAATLEVLRNIHNADVPDSGAFRQRSKTYFEQQVEIFNQALECFDTFRRIRLFLSQIKSELRDFPDGHPGIFASFAAEMSEVSRIKCLSGNALKMSNLRSDHLFFEDPNEPDSPLHRYTDELGCNEHDLREFILSSLIITDKNLITFGQDDDQYYLGNEQLCSIAFADTPENTGGNQCFLYPKEIIDQLLTGTSYDFLETPDERKNLKDLDESSLDPESLAARAYEFNRLFFDIGAATNIGGLSNSAGVFNLPASQLKWNLESVLGLQDLDPWGNPKKMSLLKLPKQFERHANYHQNLIGIIEQLGSTFMILENRYAAWKKGRTPDNSEKEGGWINQLSAENQHLRMLHFAYRWHIHLQSPDRDKLGINNARMYFTELSSPENGPVSDFWIDIDKMQLVLHGETIQLPTIHELDEHSDVDALAYKLCISEPVQSAWHNHVSPFWQQLMPTIDFN